MHLTAFSDGIGRREPGDGADGYTLIELTVVLAIMSIVLVIASSALISLQNASTRNNAMITDEQNASSTLALLSRDIRSAHSITFVSTTTNAANSLVLEENQPAGGLLLPVEWTFVPPVAPAVVGTLSRIVLTSSLTVSSTQVMLTDLANTATNPVFSYYDLQGGTPMATGTAADNVTLQSCTTAIGLNLSISPSPVPGVSNFQESNSVAIYDQQQILSAPGNAQCGL
jgi:prepilin-type N-terminal cleavage/methylation domain-containing protein